MLEDTPQGIDGPSKLDQAADAVQAATHAVRETTKSVADAIEAGRRPGAPLAPVSVGPGSATTRGHHSVPGRRTGRAPEVIGPGSLAFSRRAARKRFR